MQRREAGRLSKNKFSELLGKTWQLGMKPENIKKAFSSTGIFPVDRNKFPITEFNSLALRKYNEIHSSTLKNGETQDITCSHSNIINSDVLNAAPVEGSCSSQKFITPNGIIDIFTKKLDNLRSNNVSQNVTVKRQLVPRLKPIKYGEILTTKEVLAKLEETELMKSKKKISKNVTLKLKKRSKKQSSSGSESEGPLEKKIVREENDTDSDKENWILETLRQNTKEVEYRTATWDQLKVGGFVLVDFLGGPRNTTHYKYVCCIREKDVEEGDIMVTGLKRENELSTEFTVDESDIASVTLQDIVAILPNPEMKINKRKIIYVFPGVVSVFEK